MLKSRNIAQYLLCAALGLVSSALSAQDTDFDLSSQRSESQDVHPVPGNVLDHNGFILNPRPRVLEYDLGKCIDVSGGLRLLDKGRFSDVTGFVKTARKGKALNVDFGASYATEYPGLKRMSGAYILDIDAKGVTIRGYDERGAFYGLMTLRQLIEDCPVAGDGKLPYLHVEDYPAFADRGVVEGFYGTPWSHATRLSLIDFYGRMKLNTYLYGPKDDPYHSCPNWRLPYPETEAANIRDLVEACKKSRVDFVWAIHPGQDIKWNEEDYHNLLNKFEIMYGLGVRSFAIFFDDISGEGTNPMKQVELLNRLTEEFVKVKGDVAPLTVCPTDYSRLWAKPGPEGPLSIYGRYLDPGIKVFWTGDVVCSDLTADTMKWINERIKRPAFYWWNYPVTDYARHIVMQGPVYGLETDLTSSDLCGIVSNPMEHGEASKLALYGVADYAWQPEGYNPIDNWERGIAALAPKSKDAYRTFAIHSCDTEDGYRRDESWETKTFRLADWNEADAAALKSEFERVRSVRNEMEIAGDNPALLAELEPWLKEAELLGQRGLNVLELMSMYHKGADDSAFWNAYVSALMNEDEKAAYKAHRFGTMKLYPFCEYGMDDMQHGFLQRLSGKTPEDYVGMGSFGTAATPMTKLMLDGNPETFYTSGAAQKEGDWIGVDLRDVREISRIEILQGRNSVDDVDFFDHAVLEYYSGNGQWTAILDDLVNAYDISWSGEPVKSRYVRLRRLDSKRTNYASVREFKVNPQASSDPASDLNPATSEHLSGTMDVTVPFGVKSYVLLMNRHDKPVKVSVYDNKGQLLQTVSEDSAYAVIDLERGASVMSVSGEVEIFEIVPLCQRHNASDFQELADPK